MMCDGYTGAGRKIAFVLQDGCGGNRDVGVTREERKSSYESVEEDFY